MYNCIHHMLKFLSVFFLLLLCGVPCKASEYAADDFMQLLREATPINFVKERNLEFAGGLPITYQSPEDKRWASLFGFGATACPWDRIKGYSEQEEQVSDILYRIKIRGNAPGKPLVVFAVHGTWSDAENFGKDSWGATLTIFVRHAARMLAYVHNGPVHLYTFRWSGDNTKSARWQAVGDLKNILTQQVQALGGTTAVAGVWAVAHSHGGNVVAGAAQELVRAKSEVRINQAVLIGTPEIEDYGIPTGPQDFGIDHLCCLYSTGDITGLAGSLYNSLVQAVVEGNYQNMGSTERKLGERFCKIGQQTGRVSFVRLVGEKRMEGSLLPVEFNHVNVKDYAVANMLGIIHAVRSMRPFYDFDAYVTKPSQHELADTQCQALYESQPYPCMVIRHTDQVKMPLPDLAAIDKTMLPVVDSVYAQSVANYDWCMNMGFDIRAKKISPDDPLLTRVKVLLIDRLWQEIGSAQAESKMGGEIFKKFMKRALASCFGFDQSAYADPEVQEFLSDLVRGFNDEQLKKFLKRYLTLRAKFMPKAAQQDSFDGDVDADEQPDGIVRLVNHERDGAQQYNAFYQAQESLGASIEALAPMSMDQERRKKMLVHAAQLMRQIYKDYVTRFGFQAMADQDIIEQMAAEFAKRFEQDNMPQQQLHEPGTAVVR